MSSLLLFQPDQMVVLPSFFVQRERALFLPTTLLTFPSVFISKESVPPPAPDLLFHHSLSLKGSVPTLVPALLQNTV